MNDFDYIIIGAGSAGCALASRLTENPDMSVLLLEAGGWDRDPLIGIPLGIGKIFPQRRHDWNYFFKSEEAVGGRAIECARGMVVGGSSAINLMTYARGHRDNYESWARSGADGWSYEDVLPYFKRSESWEGGADAHRGGSGPLTVQRTRYDDGILRAIIAAGEQAGYPVTHDYNGEHQEGFGLTQQTIRSGKRCSAAIAYLHPAARRPNLTVRVGALVTRLARSGARFDQVNYLHNDAPRITTARREIILAAGVINTPKILMLSGVGPAEHLATRGIRTEIDLPGVGANLKDHFSFLVSSPRKSPSTFLRNMRFDRLALAMMKAGLLGKGFASDVPSGAMAFLKSPFAGNAPDIQLLFLAATFPAHPYLAPFIKPFDDRLGCRVALLQPESAGTVRLASNDALAAPIIEGNFLATDKDRATLRAGLAMAREVLRAPALQAFVDGEFSPGGATNTAEAIDAFIRSTGTTVHHPAGTCRMGAVSDRLSVVGPDLRVVGTEGLRIADASVMPDLVGGNINAVVMMIGEKAADLILKGSAIKGSKAAMSASHL